MIPLIVIRPRPGAERTVAAARELGLEAQAWPLFEVEPRAWEPPDPAKIDALLVGSANAISHAGPALAQFGGKPVHAVGEATAAACRAAGLNVAAVGQGGLQQVLDAVAPISILRLAGDERIELVAPRGVQMTERVVYASRPIAIPAALAEQLAEPAVVALHSAAAARHFAAECRRAGIVRGNIALATIGPRVSAAAGFGWADIATARYPQDQALLACAVQLCQNPTGP